MWPAGGLLVGQGASLSLFDHRSSVGPPGVHWSYLVQCGTVTPSGCD